MQNRILIIALLFISLFNQSNTQDKTKLNQTLLNLEPNVWHKIHEVKKGDKVFFLRQEHGGSCFDTKRGLLILFGSNTHTGMRSRGGKLESSNSPRYFNPITNEWTEDYTGDDTSTYKVDEKGAPVAGEKGDHPWAMHTFGSIEYDPQKDQLVVASLPWHVRPQQGFTNMFKDMWPTIKQHPTWIYDLDKKTWSYLPSDNVHFFPNCTAFDTDRNIVIGHNSKGIYEFAGEPRKWTQVVSGGHVGWHNNGIYDSKNKVFIGFGTNKNSDEILAYDPKKKNLQKMPTPGARPPADQHNPMAFEPNIGKTVVLVDREKATTETWLYDYSSDSWQQIKTASFDVALWMNYNLEYDPNHKVLLLVEGGLKGRPTATWALKIKEEK